MRRHPPRIRNQPSRVGCTFGVSGSTVQCITALVSCLSVTSSESPLPLPATANSAISKVLEHPDVAIGCIARHRQIPPVGRLYSFGAHEIEFLMP